MLMPKEQWLPLENCKEKELVEEFLAWTDFGNNSFCSSVDWYDSSVENSFFDPKLVLDIALA